MSSTFVKEDSIEFNEGAFQCMLLKPCFYLIFFALYGKEWGNEDDKDCEGFFPTWMLINGLAGLLFPFVTYMAQLSRGVECKIAALSYWLGACTWWAYGQILLLDSETGCGMQMWMLAFVSSCFTLGSLCLICCSACAVLIMDVV